MAAYAAAKARALRGPVAVAGVDDPAAAALLAASPAAAAGRGDAGGARAGAARDRRRHAGRPRVRRSGRSERGVRQVQRSHAAFARSGTDAGSRSHGRRRAPGGPPGLTDALAAAALARAAGVAPEHVAAGLAGVPARPAPRATWSRPSPGVRYVDDSKATNPHAAAASLAAQAPAPVVWIVGGLLKGASVDELVARHARGPARGGGDRHRPARDRRRAGATRAGRPRRGGRGGRRWPDDPRAHRARRPERPDGRSRSGAPPPWPGPVTSSCSRRRRRRWTSSATTPTAAARSPPRSPGWRLGEQVAASARTVAVDAGRGRREPVPGPRADRTARPAQPPSGTAAGGRDAGRGRPRQPEQPETAGRRRAARAGADRGTRARPAAVRRAPAPGLRASPGAAALRRGRRRVRAVAAPPADLAAPDPRRLRPADAVRPGHGAVGVVGGELRRRRLVVLGVRQAADVLRARARAVLGRAAHPAAEAAGARRADAAASASSRWWPVLIPGLGALRGGSRAWFAFGPFSLQPSEAVKIALTLWGAHVLALRRNVMHRWKHALLAGRAGLAADLRAADPAARPRHDGLDGHGADRAAVLRGRADAADGGAHRRRAGRRGRSSGSRRATGRRASRRSSPRRPRTRSGPATRPPRRCTRWPTAGCSASGSARAGPSGATCPTPTTTSSSRSSARSWASSGAFAVLALFATLAYTGLRIAARSADPWLAYRRGHVDDVAGRPGRHQHRLRRGAAAGDRAAAPADLLRRNLARGHHVRLRGAGQRGPARARGRRGPDARRAAAPGAPRPVAASCASRRRSPTGRPGARQAPWRRSAAMTTGRRCSEAVRGRGGRRHAPGTSSPRSPSPTPSAGCGPTPRSPRSAPSAASTRG